MRCCRTIPEPPAVRRFTRSVKMSINPQRWQSLTPALERGPRLFFCFTGPIIHLWLFVGLSQSWMIPFACVWVCVLDRYNLVRSHAACTGFSPLEGLLQDSAPLPPTAADRDDVPPPPLLGRPAGGLWPPAGPPHHRLRWDALCRTRWVDHITIISCTSLTSKLAGFVRCTI